MKVFRTLMVFLLAFMANNSIAQQKPNPSKKAKSTTAAKTNSKGDSSRKKPRQKPENVLAKI